MMDVYFFMTYWQVKFWCHVSIILLPTFLLKRMIEYFYFLLLNTVLELIYNSFWQSSLTNICGSKFYCWTQFLPFIFLNVFAPIYFLISSNKRIFFPHFSTKIYCLHPFYSKTVLSFSFYYFTCFILFLCCCAWCCFFCFLFFVFFFLFYWSLNQSSSVWSRNNSGRGSKGNLEVSFLFTAIKSQTPLKREFN